MFDESIELRNFDPLYGPTVASWVRDDAELFRLAPSTRWPLTAAKVAAWTRSTDRPVLLFEVVETSPCGYAELNPLRGSRSHLWIGHVVIDPAKRGCGLGKRFTRLLVEDAFADPRVRRLTMLVVPGNQPALRCYQAVGFGITGQERHQFGPGRDDQIMLRLELTRTKALQRLTPAAAQELPA